MAFYPMYVRLEGKRCLLVGLGGVGRRKLATLLEAAPREVMVLDTSPAPEEARELLKRPEVRFEQRDFSESDLFGVFLAVAATPDREVNALVARLCKEQNVLCNVVDAPDEGDFIVPAQACCGDLNVSVSTSGHSPALARRIKHDLQEYLGLRYEPLLAVMGRLRPLILELGRPTAENTELFRALVDSPLAEALQSRDREQAAEVLRSLLPEPLHPALDEVLHGLA